MIHHHTYVEKAIAAGLMFHIAAAGGGSMAVAAQIAQPGRSSIFNGFNFINGMDLFRDFVGVAVWAKYASMESAEKLARKSLHMIARHEKPFGIGIACSLAAENERPDRKHVVNIVICGRTAEHRVTQDLTDNSNRDAATRRTEQELKIGNLLVEALNTIVDGRADVQIKNIDLSTKINANGEINIYPGSFNPIHDGHRELKEISERVTGASTVYEISTSNFSKQPILLNTAVSRIALINDDVLVTESPTILDKAYVLLNQYPQIKKIRFVVGMDTWERISEVDLEAIASDPNRTVEFVVFARGGKWIDVEVREMYPNILFRHELLETFSNDLSSSAIRAGK